MRVEVDVVMLARVKKHVKDCEMCKALGHRECSAYEAIVEFHLLIVTTRHEVETGS